MKHRSKYIFPNKPNTDLDIKNFHVWIFCSNFIVWLRFCSSSCLSLKRWARTLSQCCCQLWTQWWATVTEPSKKSLPLLFLCVCVCANDCMHLCVHACVSRRRGSCNCWASLQGNTGWVPALWRTWWKASSWCRRVGTLCLDLPYTLTACCSHWWLSLPSRGRPSMTVDRPPSVSMNVCPDG